MARFRIDLRGGAFRSVLGFTFGHWRRQPGRVAVIMAVVLLSTLADVLTPLYSGRLVDAVASGAASDASPGMRRWPRSRRWSRWRLGAILFRHLAFMAIIDLTLKMMADIAADAFHRVQRFSTDWHANSFAGSTVRKVTRGMWALDLLNDTHPDRAVPVDGHAGRLDDPARLVLAADGAGRRRRLAASISR